MIDPALGYAIEVEVEVGGAVMFGVPVERFVRIPGDSDLQPGTVGSDAEEAKTMTTSRAHTEQGREAGMKLVVAVVKGEDLDSLTQSLLEADVRLTRISTTGGFLRRGNSTLLIGVPANEVDEVIRPDSRGVSHGVRTLVRGQGPPDVLRDGVRSRLVTLRTSLISHRWVWAGDGAPARATLVRSVRIRSFQACRTRVSHRRRGFRSGSEWRAQPG